MNNCIRFSQRASLAVTGIRVKQLGIWQTIEKYVQIKQKVIKYTPVEKLQDAFINIMAVIFTGFFGQRSKIHRHKKGKQKWVNKHLQKNLKGKLQSCRFKQTSHWEHLRKTWASVEAA